MGSPTETPKEDAYDEHISPLMTKIIALCKEHKINAFATFSLDAVPDDGRTLRCTTALAYQGNDDQEGLDLVLALRDVAKPRIPFVTTTITGVPHGE